MIQFMLSVYDKAARYLRNKVDAYPPIRSGSRLCYKGGTSNEIYKALTALQAEIKNRKTLTHANG